MKDFASLLLAWYDIHKRDLPWRNTRDPYLIWISEIILQQTRVTQGYAYFTRFVSRFPDVQTLASASLDEVLKYWEGLGYYTRARNLHAAAQSMGGKFPSTYQGVLALKGVGEYTAAAICSFAYQMPYAVVDGNVYRVLARLFGIDTPTDSTEGKKQFAALAQKLLDKKRPDDYNQAIMDFGALVCTPQTPACAECPFSSRCRALEQKRVEDLPVKQGKTKVSHRFFSYIYVVQGRNTWLAQRNKCDIWQGLYEFPLIESPQELTARELEQVPRWREWFGAAEGKVWGSPVKHVLSHQVIHAQFFKVEISPRFPAAPGFIRVPVKSISRYALPRLVQKFLQEQGLLTL